MNRPKNMIAQCTDRKQNNAKCSGMSGRIKSVSWEILSNEPPIQEKPHYRFRIGLRIIFCFLVIMFVVCKKGCAQKKTLTTGRYIVTQAKLFKKTVVVKFKETGYKEWIFDRSLFVAKKRDTIYWINKQDSVNNLIINVD